MKPTYEQMGMMALIPGMQHMLDMMQKQLDELRAQAMGIEQPKRIGRPPGIPNKPKQITAPAVDAKTGWPVDPEERKKEAQKRYAARSKAKPAVAAKPTHVNGKVPEKVAAERNGQPLKPYLHIGNPQHPKHAEWLKKLRAKGAARWSNMSAEQRQETQDKMRAARRIVVAAKGAQQ